jgi:hypothetical protein
MFQIVSNVFNRSIITSLSLDEYINTMKNPDFVRKSQVDLARETYKNSELKKDDPLYKSIKNSLPCITFLNTFKDYVNNDNIIGNTGFMYVDVDNVGDINFSIYPFVVSYWKSLSNNGYGVLIKCENIGELQDNLKELSSFFNIELDKNAVSKDRLNVLGYDNSIYYNPNYTSYKFNDYKKVSLGYIKESSNRLQQIDTKNETEDIRFSNLKDLIKEYNFNGEPFIDLGENKLEYAEVFIPKNIFEGNRNKSMFVLCSQIRGLNSWISESMLFRVCSTINKDKFKPELSVHELSEIVKKVYLKENPVVMLNKSKRILFNPDYTLSKFDKQSMATKQIRAMEAIKNTSKIIKCREEWDFQTNGKITQQKIAKVTGFGIATIKRRSTEIKKVFSILNEENLHN